VHNYIKAKPQQYNMKRIFIFSIFILLARVNGQCAQTSDSIILQSNKAGWKVVLNDSGSITQLQMIFNNKLVNIPWRTDANGGPAWKGITLKKVTSNKILFEGRQDEKLYSLEYKDVEGKFTIVASLKNESAKIFLANPSISIRLGIDSNFVTM
jgi:hypothetical protein